MSAAEMKPGCYPWLSDQAELSLGGFHAEIGGGDNGAAALAASRWRAIRARGAAAAFVERVGVPR